MKLNVELMTYDNFKSFGCMLSYPEDEAPDIVRDDLDYWKRPMDLSGFQADGELSFMRVKRREIVLRKLDKMTVSPELYLSLDGCACIYFVAPPASGENARPDTAEIRAFLYSGPGGVLIHPGVWHCTPFPLAHDADFFLGLSNKVILKKGKEISVGENQFVTHPISEPVGVSIRADQAE